MDERIDQLQSLIQTFVRGFGLLEQNKTPCGYPVHVTQAHALLVLAQKQPLTQQDLAKQLSLDKSTVSRLVDTLVEKRWVQKNTNPDNRREVHISLTDSGLSVHQQIERQRRKKYQEVMRHIPVEQRERVLEGLEMLVHALNTEKDE